MKAVFITGNHQRHEYVVNEFSKIFKSILWVKQLREGLIIESKQNKGIIKKINTTHFKKRFFAEKKYFKIKRKSLITTEILNIKKNEINSLKVKKIIKTFKPNCIITFGCGMLDENYSKLGIKYLLNIHGGLSPWYKGAITNFWPTYMLEPQFTGMTMHHITSKIDGGNILFQTGINLNKKDGINDNSCKAVVNFCKIVPKKLLKVFKNKKKNKGLKQKVSGRVWTKKMWTSHHLLPIYQLHRDKINEYCIKHKLNTSKPKLLNVC